MKWAVIVGVLSMIFGILMKAVNSIYFRDWLTFFCEFIPQILFMGGMFGYMIVLIYVKWLTDWSD